MTAAGGQREGPVEKRPLSRRVQKKLYQRRRSIVDFLPWVEYLPEHQVILFQDGISVGAVYEIEPVGTAGRTQEHLTEVRDTIQDALQDSLDEHDQEPWVIQTYTFDQHNLDEALRITRDYANKRARGSEYTEAYMELMRRHYAGICQPEGLFFDNEVTQTQWAGSVRRNYMVIYRKYLIPQKRKKNAEHVSREVALINLKDTCDKLTYGLSPARVRLRRMGGVEFHNWMIEFFNPSTDLFGGDTAAFYREVQGSEDSLPYGNRFAETMFYGHPRSDQENNCWWFNDSALRCISIDGIRRRPVIGHATGETQRGDATNAFMDLMPPGSVFVSTIVVIPQDSLENHIQQIEGAAIGENSESSQVRTDCTRAKEIIASRQKMYRAQYAVYVRGESVRELNERTTETRARLLNYGFRAISTKDDYTALDSVIRNLPMVYDPQLDAREGWRGAQITLVQHIANLFCGFGRTRGTGHPGLAMFNRGGEPIFVDPLNKNDRKKNAHMLLFGPTGAGKSATLVSMLAHTMAVHRPRMFIMEVGNSFGLLGEWFRENGLTVNHVSLKPSSRVSLAPFKDAHLVLDSGAYGAAVEYSGDDDDEGEDEPRDVLGEMEVVAMLMITGGEENEARDIKRHDRSMIRAAIIDAAQTTSNAGRDTLTEDVRDAFFRLAEQAGTDGEAQKLRNMGRSIDIYCHGFDGEVFNSEGTAWEEADVTIIDLATFAREGYEANLALAVISCLNMINNIAERDQFLNREIVVAIDESHTVTTHPMLSPYLVKIVKMWRKLGCWLWSATQNMEDYPESAKKVLNMVEWWFCLVMPKEELGELARFKSIDQAQQDMLLSTKKAPGKFAEGVILSDMQDLVVRNVPPSLMFALAQTEKHEKANRAALMKEHGITELEAALKVADQIDRSRGIIHER